LSIQVDHDDIVHGVIDIIRLTHGWTMISW